MHCALPTPPPAQKQACTSPALQGQPLHSGRNWPCTQSWVPMVVLSSQVHSRVVPWVQPVGSVPPSSLVMGSITGGTSILPPSPLSVSPSPVSPSPLSPSPVAGSSVVPFLPLSSELHAAARRRQSTRTLEPSWSRSVRRIGKAP